MIYDLPETLTVMGEERPIRSDYRAALDICAALADPELTGREKTLAALCICYPRLEEIPPEGYQEALERCFWFLDGGEEAAQGSRPGPRLMDWEQDFSRIVAPVNRVLGREVREGPATGGPSSPLIMRLAGTVFLPRSSGCGTLWPEEKS